MRAAKDVAALSRTSISDSVWASCNVPGPEPLKSPFNLVAWSRTPTSHEVNPSTATTHITASHGLTDFCIVGYARGRSDIDGSQTAMCAGPAGATARPSRDINHR